jgi:hypothetical protein
MAGELEAVERDRWFPRADDCRAALGATRAGGVLLHTVSLPESAS